MISINKSNFTENIIALNQLTGLKFKTWLLKPGMRFGDPDKWWASEKPRPTLHEGLDLTAFLDNANGEYQLTKNTIVPPLYRGRLVNIIDDFLGQTVIVNHEIVNLKGESLHGFYSHLSPTDKLKAGSIVNETESLGTIAAGNHFCPAHLHISTVWISGDFLIGELSWPDFARQKGFQPCDPLTFF